MARPTISQLHALGDAQGVFRWNVIILKFPPALSGFDSEDINFRIETTEMPKRTGEDMIINMRGMKVKQSGIYTPAGTLSVTFNEYVDHVAQKFIRDWKQLAFDPETGQGVPQSQLKGDIAIQLLDSQDVAHYQYNIRGVYMTDADRPALDGATSDLFKPTAVLSYDTFTEEEI